MNIYHAFAPSKFITATFFTGALLCNINKTIAQNDALFISPQGNVGIGTNAPKNKLQVEGDIHVDGNAVYFKKSAENKKDVIRTNAEDRLTVAGSRGVVLGNTGGSTDSVLPVLTVGDNKVAIGRPLGNEALEVNGRIKDQTGFVMPPGGIIMWHGDVKNIDMYTGLGRPGTVLEGWAICDGNHGTPDLLWRYPYGIYPYEGTKTGEKGGESMHTLTVDEMPPHGHQIGAAGGAHHEGGGHGNSGGWTCDDDCAYQTSTRNTGGGRPFPINPPHTTVLFIMKL